MRIHPFFYTILTLPSVSPLLLADISMGVPAVANLPRQGVYHSDLLASNAVYAVFKGIRSIPVVDLAVASPASEEVAVFEVKQNLAHRRYDRMGDGALNVGKLFSVSLAADVPGQAADVGRQIREMKPGEEALLHIDHIYLFREEGNENVRACTRFAKVEPRRGAAASASGAPEATSGEDNAGVTSVPGRPASAGPSQQAASDAPREDTQTIAPLSSVTGGTTSSYASSVESRISIVPDGKGGVRQMKVEIRREWVNGEDKPRVRKFINDVEVDPDTDRPLSQDKPAAAPDKAKTETDKPADKAPDEADKDSEPAPIAPEFGF